MKYLYDSDYLDDEQEELIARLEDEDVEIVDTTDWSDDQREEVYFSELMPRSVKNQKKLRGRVRSHQAGKVSFVSGVLLTPGNFYVGDEIAEHLNLILVAGGA